MSTLARRNGWRGFDCATRVEGGWQYDCDGMPSMWGCGERVTVSRKWSRVGVKKGTGWLVCYGREFPPDPGDDGKGNDLDVVLTYCPACRAVVEQQDKS